MGIDPRFLILDLSSAAFGYYLEGRASFEETITPIYGDDITAFIEEEIDLIWGESYYECSDSFRFAVVGNPADRLAFELSHSCCGQADFEFRHSSGVTFLYGFNYGH